MHLTARIVTALHFIKRATPFAGNLGAKPRAESVGFYNFGRACSEHEQFASILPVMTIMRAVATRIPAHVMSSPAHYSALAGSRCSHKSYDRVRQSHAGLPGWRTHDSGQLIAEVDRRGFDSAGLCYRMPTVDTIGGPRGA